MHSTAHRISPSAIRSTFARGAAVALLALGASCATPYDVNTTRALAKDYESQVFDLERKLAEKNRELESLHETYARQRRSSITNAGTGDSSLQARLDNLASMIGEREGPVQDVERFDVEGGYLFMVQDRILFDSGSASLGAEGSQALASIAQQIAAAPHGTIYVRGHTDSDPVKKPETLQRFPGGNLDLSAARAVAVGSSLLSSASIRAADVVVMGFGAHKPVKPNTSPESKRLNRRVEIFVSDPGSTAE